MKIKSILASTVLAIASLKLAMLVKISMIVGPHTAFLSGSAVAMPMIGAFGGVLTSLGACLFDMLTGKMGGLHLLAYHIPGLCAALYWASSYKLFWRFLLPAACFLAFVLHPVGGVAFPYALYWLIPIFIYLRSGNNLFLQALGSTLVAHAVGSIIWLYTVPMTAQAWLGLIPVVALERMIFAAGMVVVYVVGKYVQRALSRVLTTLHVVVSKRWLNTTK